jgi:hypothetical protein
MALPHSLRRALRPLPFTLLPFPFLLFTFSLCLLTFALPAQAQAGLRLEVTEVARSVRFTAGKPEEFLTLTVEITGADAARLRRVQPFRDDFEVLAGGQVLPCRWLRGGSLPEDPRRLRFTLGFSLPPAGTKKVELRADLPRLEGDQALELRLTGLQPGSFIQERQGEGWSLTVQGLGEKPYTPPALPPKGQYISKAGPADARVFRKSVPGGAAPERAMVLAFRSGDVGLYDPTLDVTGHLLVDGGPSQPLLSAVMRREPSRAVKNPAASPVVWGEFHFQAPAGGRVTGAVIRLHRRPANPAAQPVRIPDLPVP